MAQIIEIEEEKKLQSGVVDYSELMTEEQKARGDYYSTEYFIRRSELDAQYKQEFDDQRDMYECKRAMPVTSDEHAPCNFVPLVTPTIEGQVAAMMESSMDFRHFTNNPAHKTYMTRLDAASEYYRRKNGFKAHFKDFARLYDLHGNSWVVIEWDDTYKRGKNEPQGLPRITVPPILSVLFDGSIKDTKDVQYSAYCMVEKGFRSVAWARRRYGDKYADALLAGFNRYEGNENEVTYDDSNTFTLIDVYTRDNPEGNLQKIEMDANGLIFSESDASKPYYSMVGNEYPIGIARMMPRLGRFYGFGDGTILKPMQDTVNKLTDELEIAARFSAQTRTFVDPDSDMDGDQMTSHPGDIVWCKDPNNNIRTEPGKGLNPVVFDMIQFLLDQAKKATRFHESMTGTQGTVSATATQINTQQSQGYVGIKDKKADLADVMGWADMYALRICLEKWDRPFWAALGQDSSEYVDVQSMESVGTAVPLKTETVAEAIAGMRDNSNKIPDLPYYEGATDENGEPIKTDLDFTTNVIIGESIPKGRTDMYNMLLGIAQMQALGEDGMPKPIISVSRLIELLEETVGFKLRTEEEMKLRNDARDTMNAQTLTQINPIGQGNTVQTPTASNLQQTVPQMPGGDSRSVQI